MVEGLPHEAPDVGHGDVLDAGPGGERRAQDVAVEEIAVPQEVLHEGHGAEDRAGEPDLLQVLLDAPLGLEVGDAGVAVRAPHRRVDEVADAGSLGAVGEGRPLTHLSLRARLPEVLHGEDPVHALERGVQRGRVVEVPLDDLRTFRGELLGRRSLGMAGQGVHVPAAAEQLAGHRTPLPPRGAGDEDRLLGLRGRARGGAAAQGGESENEDAHRNVAHGGECTTMAVTRCRRTIAE